VNRRRKNPLRSPLSGHLSFRRQRRPLENPRPRQAVYAKATLGIRDQIDAAAKILGK